MDYNPVPILKFPTRPVPLTAEQRYWRGYKNALLRADRYKITTVAACPKFYVIGSETRFRFFNYANKNRYSISMFKAPVIKACFREDGSIFAGADNAGKIKIFQTKKKIFLKEFKHRGAVHALTFQGDTRLISGGDDKNLKVWDIS
jgi:U3 small nucleolar RNA-associated protein 15